MIDERKKPSNPGTLVLSTQTASGQRRKGAEYVTTSGHESDGEGPGDRNRSTRPPTSRGMRTQTTQPGAVRRMRPVMPRAIPVSIRGSRPVTPRTRAAKPRPVAVRRPRPDATCRKGRCAKSLRSDRDRKQNRPDRVTPSRRLQPKPERWR